MDRGVHFTPFLATRDTVVKIASTTFTGHILWSKQRYKEQEQRISGEVLLCSSPDELRLQITPKISDQNVWTLLEGDAFLRGVSGRTQDLLGQIDKAKEYLACRPMEPRGDTVKILTGDRKGRWRYRIGDYRLVYHPHSERKCVELLDFGPRGRIYES